MDTVEGWLLPAETASSVIACRGHGGKTFAGEVLKFAVHLAGEI
jgi:hypothetical protein